MNTADHRGEPDYLDMRDTAMPCARFEGVLSSGKLHQYVRILAKKGILPLQTEDEDAMMTAFLASREMMNTAYDAWDSQPVLITATSDTNVHNLKYHIRGLLSPYFRRRNPDFFEVLDMKEPWSITLIKALRRAGYTHLGQLKGKTIGELMEIPGVGQTSAPIILQGIERIYRESEGETRVTQ